STGARIPSAKVVARSVDSSIQREASSEDRGEFRMDDLLPGYYQITENVVGFAQAQAEDSIAIRSVRDVTVTLRPLEAPETMNAAFETQIKLPITARHSTALRETQLNAVQMIGTATMLNTAAPRDTTTGFQSSIPQRSACCRAVSPIPSSLSPARIMWPHSA